MNVDDGGRADRSRIAATAGADPELAGIDLEAAAARARAAARQTAGATLPATAALSGTADADDVVVVVAPTDHATTGAATTGPAADPSGWAMPAAGIGAAAGAVTAPGVGPAADIGPAAGIGPASGVDAGDALHTTHHDDPGS